MKHRNVKIRCGVEVIIQRIKKLKPHEAEELAGRFAQIFQHRLNESEEEACSISRHFILAVMKAI